MSTKPYSYSRLAAFLRCPAQFRFRYVERLPEPVSALAQAGQLAHAVFELYARHCMQAGVPTDLSALRNIARACFERHRDDALGRGEPCLSEADYDDLVRTIIVPWSETHIIGGAAMAVAVEWRIAMDADGQQVAFDSPKAWFRGVIDYAASSGGHYTVTDYKTGFAPDVDPLQMQVYAWLLLSLDLADTVIAEIDFVRFNVQKSRTYERDDLPALDERIRAIIDRIEAVAAADVYAATPGPACLHCDYADRCTARVTPPGAITDATSARQAVEALALLERDMKRGKEALRAWCVDHGPVVHNGAVWGNHTQGSDGFDDAKAFVEALQATGVDPWRYLTVNNTAAKRLVRDERLKPLLVNRRRVVFGMRKAKEAAE